MPAAPSASVAVREMPSSRTAIRNVPMPEECSCRPSGAAPLTRWQLSASTVCGGGAALQAASVIAAIAQAAHWGAGQYLWANAAILDFGAVVASSTDSRFYLRM